MKTISEYQILDHGVENSQYFQGCGVSFTKFDDVSTGIGSTPAEALDDALESLAQNDWDVSSITDKLSEESGIPESEDDENDGGGVEIFHYVSVRVMHP
jgi:hypothetical protein